MNIVYKHKIMTKFRIIKIKERQIIINKAKHMPIIKIKYIDRSPNNNQNLKEKI